MKLNNLTLNQFGACKNLRLQQFSPGLNVIHGSCGSGKSTVRNFVRAMLYGFDDDVIQSYLTGNSIHDLGQIEVNWNGRNLILAHDQSSTDLRPRLKVCDTNQTSITEAELQNAISMVPPTTYTTVFNTSFSQGRTLLGRLIVVMRNHLGVPAGHSETEDRRAYDAWQTEQNSVRNQLTLKEPHLLELNSRRASLQSQINVANQQSVERRQALQSELNSVNSQVLNLENQISAWKNSRDSIQAEINSLKTQTVQNQSVPAVKNDESVDQLQILYQRLDEIDLHLRRWKTVQAGVQEQRVQIKNEMAHWNSLGMESVEHPYHNSRQIIRDLESMVENSELNARHWIQEQPETTRANDIASNCVAMRDKLHALCEELGSQYKHVRHRAAVAELKQLRYCFTEISESIRQLANRRNRTIEQIRLLDPAGADAVHRTDYEFCVCAESDGYFVARQRFVIPALSIQPTTQFVERPAIDTSRLTKFQNELANLNVQIANSENELVTLRNRASELSRQLQALVLVDVSRLQSELNELDVEINRQTIDMDNLKTRLNSAAPAIGKIANPILVDASSMISQLTDGQIEKVWINPTGKNLDLRMRDGTERSYDSVTNSQQSLLCLAVLLACANRFYGRGIQMPVCLDDLLENTDVTQHDNIARVLETCANQGLQVILFARQSGNLNRFVNSTIRTFELNTTIPEPSPALSMPQTAYRALPPIENYVTDDSELRIEAEKPIRRHPTPRPFRQFVSQVPSTDVTAVELTPLDQSALLRNTELFEPDQLTALADSGIHTVADLLDVDPDLMDTELTRQGVSSDLIVRWQSQTWLKIAIPELTTDDTLILFHAGIDDPRQFDTLSDSEIAQRLAQTAGRSDFSSRFQQSRYDSNRIGNWRRSFDRNRSFWKNHQRYLRRSRRNRRWSDRDSNYERRTDDRSRQSIRADRSQNDREPRTFRDRQPRSFERNYESRRSSYSEREDRNETEESSSNRETSERPQAKAPGPNLKFYLNLADDLEAAPSIGPKTAERFANIGIVTVQDFLDASAIQMADDLDYKRIKAADIEQWQNQTRLVCQVPNLRGHDAQLLVACEVTDPDELARMDPDELFAVIGPFSKTKEGQKYIRSAKQPDLAEVTDWISWASQNRSLQAA